MITTNTVILYGTAATTTNAAIVYGIAPAAATNMAIPYGMVQLQSNGNRIEPNIK